MKPSRSVTIRRLRILVSDARSASAVALAWLFLAGAAGQAGAAAAIATWTGASNGAWQVNANWSPTNACPSNAADRATFNSAGNGQTNVTISGTVVLGNNNSANKGLVFDTPNAAAYTISGGTIAAPSVNGNGDYLVVVNPSVVNPQTINSALAPTVYTNVNSGQDGGYFVNNSPIARLTLSNIAHNAASTGNGTNNALQFYGQGAINVSGAIADGPSNKTSLCTARGGTTTLSGVNTFSGLYYNSASLTFNLFMGLGGTLVLDYANMTVSNGTNTTTVLPNTTSINFGGISMLCGTMVFRGIPDPSVVTAQSLDKFRITRGQTTFVLDRNGGGGVQLALSTNWTSASGSGAPAVAFDLSSGGGTVRLAGTNFSGGGTGFTYLNGTIRGNSYAVATVKDTNSKTYFATMDANATVLPLTNTVTLPVSGTLASTNYTLPGSWTAAAAPSVNTLRIAPSANGQSMNLSNQTFTLTSQAIILDGPFNYAITNGSFASPVAFIVAGTNKLTVQATLYNAGTLYSMCKFGPGLLELTGTNSTQGGSSYLFGGVTRVPAEASLTSSNLVIGAAVLEVGYDFTRAVGTLPGQVRIDGSAGFSAYGGNHFVNLGGTNATLQFFLFNQTFFVITRDGKLMLSSPLSDSTIDFQNPLDLYADQQTIEVADGSATVDAVLSGLLSNGGLIKTGAGTLSLTTNNAYTLGTVVGAGALLANNAVGSATGTGTVTVCAGATLGGSGTVVPGVSNLVWIGGTLAPGAGTATNVAGTTLSIDLGKVGSKVQCASGATVACKLGAPGSADQIRFLNFGSGKLTLSNTTVNAANAGGLAPGQYTLMSFYSDNGSTPTDTGKPTSGLALGTAPRSLSSRIDYTQPGKIVLRVSGGGTALLFR